MKITIYTIIFILNLVFSNSYSQKQVKAEKPETLSTKFIKGAKNRALLENADLVFNNSDFQASLALFQELEKTYPEELYLKFKIGICFLNKKNERHLALPYLEKVYQSKPRLNEINFNLAQAYFYNYKFQEAIEQYKLFLTKNKEEDQISVIQHYIDNCNNAIELVGNPIEVEIKNIGKTINTEAQEYAPVISSDESILMYTYRGVKSTGGLQDNKNRPDPKGDYYEDIFVATKDLNHWQEPISIGTAINGNGHDACIALSNDGQKLFIYKFTVKELGDIYISQLKGSEWSAPKRLKGKVNSIFWEGSASLSADGKTLYFSSSNPKGFGGKDLYRATLQEDESWGNVQNLGEEINTPFDDDGPFIHPDGKTLLFSSKGHNSMGGYDIYRSNLISDTTWSNPVNMGYPINTIEDELYYVLSGSGKTGYYSSGKAGGYGGQDIYIVEPGLGGRRALILVKGEITKDEKPIEADITVEYSDTKNIKEYSNQSEFNSNSATGKYLINFPAGNSYRITYRLDGFRDRVELIDATHVEDFEVRINPVAFSSTGNKNDMLNPEELKQQQIEHARRDSVKTLRKREIELANEVEKRNYLQKIKQQIEQAKMDSMKSVQRQIDLANELSKKNSSKNLKQIEQAKKDSVKSIQQKEKEIAKKVVKKNAIAENKGAKKKFKIHQQVYFDFNNNDLKDSSKLYAEQVYKILVENKEFELEISGNSDDKGTEEYNYDLAKKRAEIVADFFIKKGIKRERLAMKYNGSSRPLAPNRNSDGSENIEGMKKNRRAEFKINTNDKSVEIEYESTPVYD